MTTNETAFSQAKSVIPGGVDSPVRAFGGVGGTPRFIASASGARVTDVEGRSYVDLVGSWGPALLGHAHPEVVAAVQEAASRGLSFGAPTETETLLAAAVRERVPFAQRVRFVSTGTEATMTAIRLARGATGRDLIVKFAGNYHGHSDGLLAAAGSGVATGGLPGSAGVPEAITAQTIVLPYNDVDALRACFEQAGESIAAVIFEGAQASGRGQGIAREGARLVDGAQGSQQVHDVRAPGHGGQGHAAAHDLAEGHQVRHPFGGGDGVGVSCGDGVGHSCFSGI